MIAAPTMTSIKAGGVEARARRAALTLAPAESPSNIGAG